MNYTRNATPGVPPRDTKPGEALTPPVTIRAVAYDKLAALASESGLSRPRIVEAMMVLWIQANDAERYAAIQKGTQEIPR